MYRVQKVQNINTPIVRYGFIDLISNTENENRDKNTTLSSS